MVAASCLLLVNDQEPQCRLCLTSAGVEIITVAFWIANTYLLIILLGLFYVIFPTTKNNADTPPNCSTTSYKFLSFSLSLFPRARRCDCYSRDS